MMGEMQRVPITNHGVLVQPEWHFCKGSLTAVTVMSTAGASSIYSEFKVLLILSHIVLATVPALFPKAPQCARSYHECSLCCLAVHMAT